MFNKSCDPKSNTGLSDSSTVDPTTGRDSINTPDKQYQLPLYLKREYWHNEKSAAEIAAEHDVSPSTIRRWMDKHDIPRRGPDSNHVNYARIEVNNYGHVTWRQAAGKTQERQNVPVHRLLAIAEFGTDAVAGMHVHHKNGIPWDNRPENLELLTPEDHAREHNEKRISDEELLLDLRAGAAVLQRPLKVSDVNNWGEYSWATYSRRFGTLKGAMEAANIDPETGELGPIEEVLEDD